jgi:DNA polymerase alpha subunit A
MKEQEQKPIFELVTEEEYTKIAKRAILEEDFVVGDNGEYSRGLEDWDHHEEENDSDPDEVKAKKPKKASRMTDHFRPKPKKVEKLIAASENDNELLGSIFQDLDSVQAQKKLKTIDAKPVPKKAAKPLLSEREHLKLSSFANIKSEFIPSVQRDSQMDDEPIHHEPENISPEIHTPIKEETPGLSSLPTVPVVKVKEMKIKTLQTKSASANAMKFLPKFEKQEKQEPTVITVAVDNSKKWTDVKNDIQVKMEVSNSPALNTSQLEHLMEDDGSIYMYWIDAFEKNGNVFLFGKVMHKETQTYVSCCINIKGIERNLFILPRTYKKDENGLDTDEDVTMKDIYEEFDQIRRKFNIKSFASKAVQRNYAFELPNIPSQSDYLKVLYPFSDPELPLSLSGKTFSKVFGCKTGALELFLLKRKIMGPCWLSLKNCSIADKKLSWCKLEMVIENPKDVTVPSSSDEKTPDGPPPMVVMSLNLRTVMNVDKNVNEIVAASTLTYTNVNIDSGVSESTAMRSTIIRQYHATRWPTDFEKRAKGRPTGVRLEENERSLLSSLLNIIFRHDPDIIVGHNVIDFDLDVLLQRMKVNRIDFWSRLGRLRRTQWPKLQAGAGGTSDSSYAERQIASGRLLCDTFRAAKDFLNSKSNSLTYLAATQLDTSRPDIEYEKISEYFFDCDSLINMLDHMEVDAYLVFQLMQKLQVIPLTKQLTNLAGNLWSRTMVGARAERNEFLLLHEFHKAKYICPDRIWAGSSQNDDGEEIPKKTGRKKAAYAGGLVLDPKVGLYDKYVLLLDFNSLYPSIIQEYNICFTTVERTYDDQGDHMPDLPEQSKEQAILPKLLASLVQRRRTVKNLMKDPKNSEQLNAQYDIRQKALKLTANSMYGCLGFSHSRFFAKPIAMLITAKGREILQRTVTLAEELNLEVIYGDTDSIMIHTNTEDLKMVYQIGEDLKKKVNEMYKLLEIEMDGLFKRLLLLKKKKYAAITVSEKDGQLLEKLETKGLDLVRRDWCDLSHNVSNKVLGFIFNSGSKETTVEKIHEYLAQVGEEVRKKLIPVEQYVINKGLTKNPHEYADKESQPHVQVALRMQANGLTAKVGDTIPYVICSGDSATIGKRAFHIDEVKKEGSVLEIDLEWYLANQIHPPVVRLCAPIEGTDTGRLAHALGLDAKKYTQHVEGTQLEEERLLSLDSQLTDAERFKDVEKFTPKCNHCHQPFEFTGLVRMTENFSLESQFMCCSLECQRLISANYLCLQLRNMIRSLEKKYLDQQVICDESTCQTKTKMHGVFGRKCLVPKCQGLLSLQVFSFDKDVGQAVVFADAIF